MTLPRLTCCMTFDFDGMSSWIGSLKSNNPSMISRGQFCAVAMPRLLRLLDDHGIRATFAVPGHTALAYPRLVREIAERGHELAHHGWVHENPAAFDEAGNGKSWSAAWPRSSGSPGCAPPAIARRRGT